MAVDPKKPQPNDRQRRNADPITGEPGAHPVGTGLGAAVGGAVTGAAAGAAGGPVGAAIGAVAGGVAGGYAGKAIAEEIDPTVETDYWRGAYEERPYYDESRPFERMESAYRFGWESYTPDVGWDEREAELAARWQQEHDPNDEDVDLTWDEARVAARDAYDRVAERATQRKPR